SVYFRKGDTFEEGTLPEIPPCDEIKGEDPKYLHTVWYKLTPESWLESGSLLVAFSGEWRTIKGEMIGCEQNFTLAFDAQHKATMKKAKREPTWKYGSCQQKIRPNASGYRAFNMEEGTGVVSGVATSPDENWMLVAQHRGSHMNATYLFHRKEGLKFEDVFPNAKW